MSFEIIKSITIKGDKVFTRQESNNVSSKEFLSSENKRLSIELQREGQEGLIKFLLSTGLEGGVLFQNGSKLATKLKDTINKTFYNKDIKELGHREFDLENKLYSKDENQDIIREQLHTIRDKRLNFAYEIYNMQYKIKCWQNFLYDL